MSDTQVGSNERSKSQRRSKAYRLSATVAIVLAILTVIEYFVGLATPSAIILLLFGLIKGYAVVVYFMHVSRLWSPQGGH
ncbi:MAG: cytochrome C oxidase subunit IV family protein [Caldilineaceae bacterium]|nr:cytochrome C oxidase subunit IV family protein [Caldilineaceae bacterium]MCB0091078.1 cytochrome C oxidase subunit IV family protein [Caldilineaceae bacterium]MCB0098401.1 cytochrome C oxidase subunit IV family protein [Caldilineaceae bacterium]MCB0139358.1 cytochrome C oxidase subunit IV family protein [Caldilineaceae bacterium]MCB9148326.1 cytochrome C oxidase subunit IV family protein [Caldilineaceae bacterium]